MTFYSTFRGTERTPQREGLQPDRHAAQPERGGVDVAALGVQLSGVFRAISGGPLARHTRASTSTATLNTQNDRPVGLPITVGRGDVDEQLAIINAYRATRNLGAVDPELLEPEPYVSVDLRLTKAFTIPSGRQLQLFAEGYNVFNRVNFQSTPNGNINSTSFLIHSTAAEARQIQFGGAGPRSERRPVSGGWATITTNPTRCRAGTSHQQE